LASAGRTTRPRSGVPTQADPASPLVWRRQAAYAQAIASRRAASLIAAQASGSAQPPVHLLQTPARGGDGRDVAPGQHLLQVALAALAGHGQRRVDRQHPDRGGPRGQDLVVARDGVQRDQTPPRGEARDRARAFTALARGLWSPE
jgi:hypothetical protein